MQQSITNQFNIGISTVMVGPMADVLNLTPEEHSIGLIKNFSLTSETNEVTLTQGLRNTQVDSQVTGVTTQLSMEVYEYTAKNIAYAAQLAGENFTLTGNYALKTAITGGVSATSVVLADVPSTHSNDLSEGDVIALQCSGDKDYDKVFLASVSSTSFVADEGEGAAKGTLTVTLASAIPSGWSFAAGDKVFFVNVIPVGSDEPQPYYGVKIVGILPNGNEPVTIICPKAKVSAGFNLGFTTDNYGNMPFEFTPYDLTKEDYANNPALEAAFKKYGGANCFVYKG